MYLPPPFGFPKPNFYFRLSPLFEISKGGTHYGYWISASSNKLAAPKKTSSSPQVKKFRNSKLLLRNCIMWWSNCSNPIPGVKRKMCVIKRAEHWKMEWKRGRSTEKWKGLEWLIRAGKVKKVIGRPGQQ